MKITLKKYILDQVKSDPILYGKVAFELDVSPATQTPPRFQVLKNIFWLHPLDTSKITSDKSLGFLPVTIGSTGILPVSAGLLPATSA
jgi:hypothetical protein